MAIRKIVSRSISDDAVTADDLDNAVNTDINVLESNIAILAFYRASDNSKSKYNLSTQVIDEYTDATGVSATTPSGVLLEGATGSKYYSANARTSGSTVTSTVNYSGSDTTISLAAGQILSGTVKAWGSGGGSDSTGSGQYGAGGGFVKGTLSYLSDGTDLVISAGQGGQKGDTGGTGGTGGGYSGIFAGSKTFANAIIVAGAGGGAGDNAAGGSGGGTTGTQGNAGGNGGSQSAGGSLGSGSSGHSQPTAGSALQGGLGGADVDASSKPTAYNGGGRQGAEPGGTLGGGGGGGGYYGGAGGHAGSTGGGGGGGSSYHNATYVSSATNTSGSTTTSGGASDANHPSGAGNAGSSQAGGNGAVYLSYAISTAAISSTANITSTAATASTAPTKGDVVMMIENASGTATLNTDIKVYVSRNNGSNWTQGTLVEEGTWGTNKKIVAFHDLDISGQPSGTAVKYKIDLANQSSGSKETRIHATSLAWS
jgi:hypothetical protein